jgi:tetratricopeptide (TPR) repeat protein
MSTIVKPIIVKSFYVWLAILVSSTYVFSIAKNNIFVNANDAEFSSLVSKADSSLQSGDSLSSQNFLAQAELILSADPTISTFLQGHYNKVKGKQFMKTSESIALGYFNRALTQFSGNTLEQYRTRLFIGITYFYANKLSLADREFRQAKSYFEANNDTQNLAQALNNIGVIYYKNGDYRNALAFCQQAFDLNTGLGNTLNANKNQSNISDIQTSADRLTFDKSDFIATDEIFDTDVSDLAVLFGGGGTTTNDTTVNTSGSGTTSTNGGN